MTSEASETHGAASQAAAPAPENRPKFWAYYRARGMERQEVADVFGRTAEWLRLITLPFGDPKRRTPSTDDIAAIHAWTRGEVGPADWYPPELSEPVSSPAEPAGERAA